MAASSIDVDTLRRRLDAGEPITVVDIRNPDARAEWSIPGSIHFDIEEAPLESFDAPRDRPVVAVCYAGNTSRGVAQALSARGYEAYSLAGGMSAWSLAWNLAETRLPSGATVLQVRRTGKGCLSYVVGDEGAALVVDPSLPPEVYADLAKARGWTIRRVLDTHVHADHLSRARLLAQRAGATLHLPRTPRIAYPYEPLDDGAELRVGRAALRVLAAPGHTDESACYLLDDAALLTGDTVFPDGVGRPDLEANPVRAKERARSLHASLQRIFALRDDVLLLAGHTSEPIAFDGRIVGATVRKTRDALRVEPDAEAFAQRIVARLPPTPPNHRVIVELNERGEHPPGVDARLEAGANRCAIR